MVLDNQGFYLPQSSTDMKRYIFLINQTIKPKPNIKKDEYVLDNRAICLNFDLENNCFEFRLSDLELDEKNRNDFFAFKLPAPKDKKKFLMTNNLNTFYSSLFKESIEYITDRRKKKNSAKYFNTYIKKSYDSFLSIIKDKFYFNYDKTLILDYNKLTNNQKSIYRSILMKHDDEKYEEIWNRFINKYFFDKDSKNISNLPGIFMITFNKKTILEYDYRKFRSSYINLCYYDLFERFFSENKKENLLCHICQNHTDIIQEIPFPIKFYGTTNDLFFEMLSNKNAYKSFSICEKCLASMLTGMRSVNNYLRNLLFNLQVYIIPNNIDNNLDFDIYNRIISLFQKRYGQYRNDIMKLNEILRKSKRKKYSFNLLFYYSEAGSQQFDILKSISNIDLQSVISTLNLFDKYSEEYSLYKIGKMDQSLTISDLRYYLFPSFYTQNQTLDYKTYSKDLLNFLEKFLNNNTFNYNSLIRSFTKIFHKRFIRSKQDSNRNQIDYLSPFKMTIAFTILIKLNQLSGGYKMTKTKYISEVLNEDYKKFFDTHHEIYKDNAFRQGLFLLGTIISKIKYAQKDKNLTFLRKINMSGVPPRRVPSLVNHVREFADIYKKQIFEEKGIWGNIYDRLQGIETCNMKPDEIVFYILTGISFGEYIGYKKGTEKKENDKGEQNDNN